ncbi:hypothetical protein C9374_009590 [Naegleria lovaniensis]|uniref:EF-hand domain-containing protein n=1 Tax=Naegleria lovaniensis TaxID=51637 RepID=A0AA88H1P0_NAELO|nr:uncharacterized protein C9374_009590 [Naegleria lovaniensis]KAG2393013.1 hypothetical protein C9374_009590 [Naegleria lovaniensis]
MSLLQDQSTPSLSSGQASVTPKNPSPTTTGGIQSYLLLNQFSLSKEQEQELLSMFQMYAKDNKVSLKDLHSLIKSNIGVKIDMEELMDMIQIFSPESMVEALNSESNERKIEKIKVDFPTFIKCLNTRYIDSEKISKEQLQDLYTTEIYNLLDANRSGTIGRAELSHFFSRALGENLVEDQIIDMLSLFKNQTISLEEFKTFVKQLNNKF